MTERCEPTAVPVERATGGQVLSGGHHSLVKVVWAGNGWAAFDIEPYSMGDFEPVVRFIVAVLGVEYPEVTFMPDGYVADFQTPEGVRCTANLDAWSFSIASESVSLRDHLFEVLSLGLAISGDDTTR